MAIYQDIAEELRRRIKDGVYAVGEALPSEPQLMDEFGVARPTVRNALAYLRRDGLIEAARGKGMFVAQPPPVLTVRTGRFSRAARRAGKGALAAEAEALGLEWSSEQLESGAVDLPPRVAEVLGEPRGAVKRRRMWVAGVPTQLADSYLPASLDEEIGWSRGATAPGGVYGLIEQHGHRITRFCEQLSARLALPDEAVALQLALGAPVVDVIRLAYDQDGRVVEYFDSVAAADKHRYVFEFDAPDD